MLDLAHNSVLLLMSEHQMQQVGVPCLVLAFVHYLRKGERGILFRFCRISNRPFLFHRGVTLKQFLLQGALRAFAALFLLLVYRRLGSHPLDGVLSFAFPVLLEVLFPSQSHLIVFSSLGNCLD